MKTLIEGGWVVAYNGRSHEVHERGSVVIESDKILHAGGPYTGAVDATISARGKLVSPGFINTHVHTAGGGGAARVRLPARPPQRHHDRHRRGRPARRLGRLRTPRGRSRRARVREPA